MIASNSGEPHETQGCPQPPWRRGGVVADCRACAAIGKCGEDWRVRRGDQSSHGTAIQSLPGRVGRFGFNEGQNLTIDLHRSDQDLPALSKQAADTVRANVNALAALGSEPVLHACVAATRTIPIVFVANNYDPIARGYVHSLAKPGGNVTGVFLRQTELAEKQVELLKEAFPGRTKLAVWWDKVSADQFVAAEHRAKVIGLEVQSDELRDPPYRFDAAVERAVNARSECCLFCPARFLADYASRLPSFSFSSVCLPCSSSRHR